MSKKTDTFAKTPAILSFQRGILVTDGAFYNLKDGEYEAHPLPVIRHGIRGTQNVGELADTSKGGDRDVSNIQQTESAKTDHDAQALVVTFGLRMIDLSKTLFACAADKPELTSAVRDSILNFAERAKTSAGAEDVARRIARNIANGSWLWRNRTVAQAITIEVHTASGESIAQFDALATPTHHFEDFTDAEKVLGSALLRGMQGDLNASLQVVAHLDFGVKGSVEVFPSQAYIEKKPTGFARPLYKLSPSRYKLAKESHEVEAAQVLGQAALRDQKISNRLRTIDTWYPQFAEVKRPLPIEPNGASLELMDFFRPRNHSAFSLFSRLNQINPDTDEGKFCIAMMLRGGVLGEKDKGGNGDKATSNETATSKPSQEDVKEEQA